jgi:hypothetical protein
LKRHAIGTAVALAMVPGLVNAAEPNAPGHYGICTKDEVLRLLGADFAEADVRRLCITRELPEPAKPSPGGLVEKDPNPPPPPEKQVYSMIPLPSPADWRGIGARPDRARWRPAYDAKGRPLSEADFAAGVKPAVRADGFPQRVVPVSDRESLGKAIRDAQPGDFIEIQPGDYQLDLRRGMELKAAGRPDAPIAIGAKTLGTVTLRMNASEGFIPVAPFWIVENLDMVGACASHDICHHAFHVVGKASSFVIRNNRLRDFNSQLKVNGIFDDFPDYGLVEGNTVYDSEGRKTGASVNKLNIDGGSSWMVRGNLIAEFEKRGGNQISFGAFMKSNGRDWVFDGNVVACYMNSVPKSGVRIGMSFGGGGTGEQWCRNQECTAEFTNGVIRNNIIVNCPVDVGIYLNRATDTLVHNNLILNSLGIDSRFSTSSVRVFNNIIDGRVKERDGGKAVGDHNLLVSGKNFQGIELGELFKGLAGLNLVPAVKGKVMLEGKGAPLPDGGAAIDICGNPRDPKSPDIGPVEYKNGKPCAPGSAAH